MWTKNEDLGHYKSFTTLLKTKYNVTVKVLHSDHGGEYLSKKFNTHLLEQGSKQQLTVHDTPECNGVASEKTSLAN